MLIFAQLIEQKGGTGAVNVCNQPYLLNTRLITQKITMIHIATVHWETDKWVDIQLNHLQKNISQPFRIYAFLSGDASKHRRKFFYASTEPIKEHAIKLNLLADIISQCANENDPLIFIDGDAFPINPLDDFVPSTLKTFPLAAIQRIENLSDIQPHPSFCLTTVGFWRRIKGDWAEGYQWLSQGNIRRTDVGGNLLKILEDENVQWLNLHRSNPSPYHPIFFGIYNNLIYHHGAGFRDPMSRYDRLKSTKDVIGNRLLAKTLDIFFSTLSLKNRFRVHNILRINRRIKAKNVALSDMVYELILKDDRFYEKI